MVVLLLGGIVAINPQLGYLLIDKTSAVTIRDEWVVTDSKNKEDYYLHEDNNSNELDTEPGIMPLAENPDVEDRDPQISIAVNNGDQVIQAVQGGNTVYGSYNVSVSGVAIKDYVLSIKASSANLTPPTGNSTVISGASGKTGNTMAANTWGYSLTNDSTSEANYGNLIYNSPSTTDTVIVDGEGSTGWLVNLQKKLVFAAKFGETVAPGSYGSNITLSVTATPYVVTAKWSNGVDSLITTMQEVESGFCKNNSKISTGTTISLKDARDSNTYTIVKLKDGKCWMQQNLRLSGSKILTPSDSNVSSNWTLPATQASSASTWTSDNTAVMSRTGTAEYGNYYTWCAATAGTCSGATSNGQIASGSICPKGWHLPTGNTNGELYNLTNGLNMSTITASPYKFPAAGYVVVNGSLDRAGSHGYYWSSTAYSATDAYRLYFYSSGFGPGTRYSGRYYGLSVRCVADS